MPRGATCRAFGISRQTDTSGSSGSLAAAGRGFAAGALAGASFYTGAAEAPRAAQAAVTRRRLAFGQHCRRDHRHPLPRPALRRGRLRSHLARPHRLRSTPPRPAPPSRRWPRAAFRLSAMSPLAHFARQRGSECNRSARAPSEIAAAARLPTSVPSFRKPRRPPALQRTRAGRTSRRTGLLLAVRNRAARESARTPAAASGPAWRTACGCPRWSRAPSPSGRSSPATPAASPWGRTRSRR